MEEVSKEKEKIILSICCITYNHDKYIRETLEGFLEQKIDFKYEILIHDDASTDKTREIIKEYQKRYPNLIKAIYQKQNQYSQGKPILENLFENANGKYLAICEGDDFWIDKNKLQKQVEFLENNQEYSAVYHNVYVVDENSKASKTDQKYYPLYEEHDIVKEDIEKIIIAGQTASIVCKNFWKKFSKESKEIFIECRANGDTKLSLIFTLIGKIKYFPEIMSCYRRTYTGDSWNARIKGKNLCEFNYQSKIELKKMAYKIYKIQFNPELNYILINSLVYIIKTPNMNNLKIFLKIFNKFEHKTGVVADLIKYIFKIIVRKVVKSKTTPKYRWPLIKDIKSLEEVLNAK